MIAGAGIGLRPSEEEGVAPSPTLSPTDPVPRAY